MGMMARKGERRERKTMLRSQARCERADNPAAKAYVTSGSTEDIGGEICPRGGVALTAAVEGSMAGETKRPRFSLVVTVTQGHHFHILYGPHFLHSSLAYSIYLGLVHSTCVAPKDEFGQEVPVAFRDQVR